MRASEKAMEATEPQLYQLRRWIREQGGRLMWETAVESVGVVKCYAINGGCFLLQEYDHTPFEFSVYTEPAGSPSLDDLKQEVAVACGL